MFYVCLYVFLISEFSAMCVLMVFEYYIVFDYFSGPGGVVTWLRVCLCPDDYF